MIQPNSERKAAQNSTKHPQPQRGRNDPAAGITISGAEALEYDGERKAAQNSTKHPQPQRGRSDPMARIAIGSAKTLEHSMLRRSGIVYRHVRAVPFVRFGFA